MKKPLITFIVILVIILAVPVYSLMKWAFQPKKPINILVLNKTVPDLERHEHRSFFWILNHHKYVDKEKNSYSFRKDYFGFFPLKPLRNKQYVAERIRLAEIINMAEENDAVYFADTYGVYFNDWYKGINRSRRSRMIYGGLNNNDYLLLKEMKDRNKLIFAEYNILGYPTSPLEKDKTESMFDIKWTEWSGKYFFSLDTLENTEFPKWILEGYRQQRRKSWEFTNSGIVLVKNDDGKIVVLENQTHLDFDMPYIYTEEEYQESLNLPYKVPYTNWFDIIDPGENDIISTFKFHVNEVGDSLLEEFFIPLTFPAVISGSEGQNYYFFAGDFADNPIKHFSAYFNGFENLKLYKLRTEYRNTHSFYWEYYEPLITGILDMYMAKTNEE